MSFSPSSGSYEVGSSFTVGVYAESTAVVLNALSGVIAYPQDLLDLVSISKNQSVISLWVQEPTFSNTSGTAGFEGIVLNPGFIGSNGKLITLTFKVKAKGVSVLTFSSGSMLANDGEGSEVPSSKGKGQFTLTEATATQIEQLAPAVPTQEKTKLLPALPVIASESNPAGAWSSKVDGDFIFTIPNDVDALRLLLDETPSSTPTVVYEPAITSKKIFDIKEGISYLHVQYRNIYGWGTILHYTVQIDTKSPTSLGVEETAVGTFKFTAQDNLSGIALYRVHIDGGESTSIKSDGAYIYSVLETTTGQHTLTVEVFDQAGNSTSTSRLFSIPVLAEETPQQPAVVSPTTFSPIHAVGITLITVLSIVIPCIALIFLLCVLLYLLWRSVEGLRMRIDKEVLEARMIVHTAFALLRKDLKEDIATLKKASEKRKLTREESKILRRLEKNIDEAEDIISKEMLDIEKEIL